MDCLRCHWNAVLAPVLFVLALCVGGTLAAQQLPPARLPLLESIVDWPDENLILDDLAVVKADTRRLLTDLNLGDAAALVDSFLDQPMPDGAFHPGVVLYSFGVAAQMKVRSRPMALQWLGVDEKAAAGQSFVPGNEGLRLALQGSPDRGAIVGDDLLLVQKKWNDQREEDEIQRWLDGREERLWPRLDEPARFILGHSGIAFFHRPRRGVDLTLEFERQLGGFRDELTAAERHWLQSMIETFAASDRQVLGMKYHDRLMELRGRALIGSGKSFHGLVNEGSADADWRPDLGLEREQIVLAIAIQMEAFPNSAASRTLPRLVLHGGGSSRGFEWLHGNMLRVLTELMGDSWNDLRAGRLALYQNVDTGQFGQFSLIGIADARDPAVVLRELERMSRLTSPEAASVRGFERDQEIARLIDDLASGDPNTAARAETRLVLAGRAARGSLKEAAEGWDGQQAAAADRILRHIDDTDHGDASRRTVSDPGFWTTLNPGLRLDLNSGTVAGLPSHTIEITPDPSKTPDEVAEAVRMMELLFGPRWSSVEVVEAGHHFVFMIGSDGALLERTTDSVAAGRQVLSASLKGVGSSPQKGQIQLWMDGPRLQALVAPHAWQPDPGPAADTSQPAWLGLLLDGQAAEVDALIPVGHLIPVVATALR